MKDRKNTWIVRNYDWTPLRVSIDEPLTLPIDGGAKMNPETTEPNAATANTAAFIIFA